jgi:hypothetical protein
LPAPSSKSKVETRPELNDVAADVRRRIFAPIPVPPPYVGGYSAIFRPLDRT